ncbi:MAG: hypothetical protein K2N60_03200 [Oscillospiraceae bacterium]|nr:hypothetical protein [Oscillospiraceae bacterium]
MKKKKFLGAVAAVLALTAVFSACSEAPAENAEAITSAETTASAAETTEAVSETDTEQTTENTAEAAEEEIPQTAAEEEEPAQVSPDSKFIDYEFIENYQGTTDIGELADKAVEFLMTTDEYAEAMSAFADIDEEFGEPYIADGKIIPQFEVAYPEDYDGDGKTETFITLAMPFRVDYSILTRFFIYADSEGNMTLLDHISGVYDTTLLNYGSFKQITFGGSGTAGVEDHTNLYGVADGKAVLLYGGRVSYSKEDCFLATYGFQGTGDFLYFDPDDREYCVIGSAIADIEDVRAMDTSNSLADIFDNYNEGDFLFFSSIGGKYYCVVRGAMDPGDIYVYENSSFTYLEDSKVRVSTNLCGLKEVTDIDINEAIAEMKSVK